MQELYFEFVITLRRHTKIVGTYIGTDGKKSHIAIQGIGNKMLSWSINLCKKFLRDSTFERLVAKSRTNRVQKPSPWWGTGH